MPLEAQTKQGKCKRDGAAPPEIAAADKKQVFKKKPAIVDTRPCINKSIC
jgi:hypothetical protein